MPSTDNIHDVVGESNIAKVLAILSATPESVTERDVNDCTPLHLTVSGASGKHEIAKALLNHGADVNASDSLGFNALHKAAEWGDTKLANILLAYGGSVDAEDKRGRTALQHAVFWRQAAYAELLINSN